MCPHSSVAMLMISPARKVCFCALSLNQFILLTDFRKPQENVWWKYMFRLGAAAHACNLSILGGRVGRITWSQEFETSLVNIVKTHLYQKYKNYLDVLVHACSPSYLGVWGRRITWTQEAEVAVSQGYITVLQPGWQSETPSQKNNNK